MRLTAMGMALFLSLSPALAQRQIPAPIYGITNDDFSANVPQVLTAIQALPVMPTMRALFDPGEVPSTYYNAIQTLQPAAFILGQPIDSSEITSNYPTVTAYANRFTQYVSDKVMGNLVDVWEVGNEINGNWTGPYSTIAQQVYAAWKIVHGASKKSAITFYGNFNQCDGSRELDAISFTRQYLSSYQDMLAGTDYILLSYYEADCNNYRPTTAVLTTFFNTLHTYFPNAQIGFGEVGLDNPVRTRNLTQAKSILDYYYGLQLTGVPGYVGGYFWWYFAEDMVPNTKPLWTELATKGFPNECCH